MMRFNTTTFRTFTLLFLSGLLSVALVLPTAAQDPALTSAERGKLDGELQMVLKTDDTIQKAGSDDNRPPFLSSTTVHTDGTTRYKVIIYSDDQTAVREAGISPNSSFEGFMTARVNRTQLKALAQTPEVSRVEAGSKMEPTNDEAAREVGARPLNEGSVNNTNYKGQGVITCIIDTGIDYDHRDFYKSNGDTRILRIWDQPDNGDSTGTGHPSGFSYGAEYTETEINNDNVSEEDTDGHGSHVTGTTASSGYELVLDGTQSEQEHRGMAPKSDIVVVKTTFSTPDIIDGISYCDQVASNEGKPVVINMSLGGHAVPHDGTSATAQAVDNVTGSGAIAVISAGNEGGDPIHTSSSVAAGNTESEGVTIDPYTANTGTTNDLFLTEFWIDGTNNLQIVVISPNSEDDTLQATGSGTDVAFNDTPDGAISIESGIGGSNGDRYFVVQLYDNTAGQEPVDGTWTIKVTNNGSSSTTYHGWTYHQTIPGSFDNGNGQYSIGSPGTAASAVTVGSYVHRWRWSSSSDKSYAYDGSADGRDDISGFSSRGPLRDGSQKPDIAAPGQGMISALSQDRATPPPSRIMPGGKHWLIQGTSMSAPAVSGSVALLLQEDGTLTPSQVKTHLTNTATVDNFVTNYGSPPNYRFGAGKLNVFGAMVDLLGGSVQREILSYEDPWTFSFIGSQTTGGSGANRIALRFTPNQDGYVTGALFHLGVASAHNLTGPLNVEVWSDVGGVPGSKLGNTVQLASSQLKDFSPTSIPLTSAGVDVLSGTDYHLVFYPSNSSDEINFLYETAGSSSGRSQTFDGTSWSGLGNDFVIRPEISLTSGISSNLPVEIASFSGVTQDSDVTLTWSTASETNNRGFRLQHQAPETSSFERIAFVKGHGTSNKTRTYRHSVEDLAPGEHTFRLEQVDADGTVTPGPSTTVSIEMREAFRVTSVSPNPVSDRATVDVTVREKQNVRVAVYNVLGQRVSVLHDAALAAEEPTTMKLGSNLSAGVYFLRVNGESFSTTKKFVRVK